jgi:DNA-binding transcriptional LysR family regulator
MRKQSGASRPPTRAKAHAFDDVQAIVVFARVIQERSFTRAAQGLGTTTSAVSKRVARLEERAGTRLISRTTRHVVPTEAGLDLYQRCLRILREVEDADLFVEGLSQAPRGLVRVSAPVFFGELFVAPLLAALANHEPALRIELVLDDRFVDLVGEGFDLAVRIGRAASASLSVRRLARTRSVACAAPSYLERRGRPLVPKDLLEHDCLRYTLEPLGNRWRFMAKDGSAIDIPVAGSFASNHGGALAKAAAAGLGVVFTPRFYVARALERGELVTVLDEWTNVDLGILAVYPSGPHQLPPKTRACIDWLARELPQRLAAKGEG